MELDVWEELDELACSTIMLTLVENVYFNMAKESTSYGIWQKLCGLYEKQSAASQFLLVEEIGGFEDEGRDSHVKSSQ